MKRLAIFGASCHGSVVAETALASCWDVVDFYDDAYPRKRSLDNLPIRGNFSHLVAHSDAYDGFHVAIGCNKTRLKALRKLLELDLFCPNIVAP